MMFNGIYTERKIHDNAQRTSHTQQIKETNQIEEKTQHISWYNQIHIYTRLRSNVLANFIGLFWKFK